MSLEKGMLNLDQLRELVGRDEIDTVLVVFTDLYGRFMGKRFDASFFLDQVASGGTHACNYLLTVDMEMEPEMEEAGVYEDTKSEDDSKEEVDETKAEDADEKSEEIEEGAELKAAPVSMPAGDDGKASPVGPGDNKQGGTTVDMSKKSSDGSKKGLTGDAKDMNVTGPQEAGDLKANPAGHGAEKKGKAE